ncbi:MAG: beta-glucuronidase [Oscillospiraceae bacterium]|nr:beta-glucuronidase [Oscillospiraceae bacterium]
MLKTIHLDGDWRFFADEDEHYTGYLPPASAYPALVRLPGTTAQNKIGKPNPKREKDCLTELYPYCGNAWFRRSIAIPEELLGKRVELFLERTRITSVWVNGQYIGTQNSLCTPHVYDLSALSGAAELEISICVNNKHYPTAGGHMTSKDTQTNWNGITGRIELRFYDDHSIRSVRAVPDAGRREVTLYLQTQGNVRLVKAEGEWCGIDGRRSEIPSQMLTVRKNADGKSFVTMPLGADAPLWDDLSPVIGKLMLHPFGGTDETEVCFGLSGLRAEGRELRSHGRKVFLRGKHDAMLFPLEGAAPTDLQSWLRVMGIAKSYGINHYRFHTCCPPDAAFTAADLLGIYMEPELPFWGTFAAPGEEQFDPQEQVFLVTEGRRILETYGNHPSFCLFSLGNELWGKPERLGEVLAYYKTFEHRILFTQGSNNFQFFPNILPEDDFFTGVRLGAGRLLRGSYGSCDQPYGHVQAERPSTMHSYDTVILPEPLSEAMHDEDIEIQYGTGVKTVHVENTGRALLPEKPIITHEIGQYCTYPDFAEIAKFTGVLQARNLEIFRERLQKAGMGERADAFFKASGKLAVQCYKEELEAVMRSEQISGFQLLDLQDFTGQGTALVGILDAFMDSKGLTDEAEWGMFCSDSVLLGLFPDYCLTDKLTMQVKLRHHAPEGVHAPLQYSVKRGQNLLAEGEIPVEVDGQGLFSLGQIEAALPPATAVHRITVTLTLPHTKNCYTLYQFPAEEMPALESSDKLCVTSDLDEAEQALSKGRSVLYLAGHLKNAVKGSYCTDFWCYPMFRSISESMGKETPVGTLGLCIDKHHPAVKGFRCDRHTTPPWYDLVTHADLAILDDLPITPTVQMIDNFERNHKLGLLFECKTGGGRLLVCTARLSEITDRYEARLFAANLLEYAASPAFNPSADLDFAQLRAVLEKEANDEV